MNLQALIDSGALNSTIVEHLRKDSGSWRTIGNPSLQHLFWHILTQDNRREFLRDIHSIELGQIFRLVTIREIEFATQLSPDEKYWLASNLRRTFAEKLQIDDVLTNE